MPSPKVGIWLTTVLWIAVTGGMWAHHDYQLKHGREISLKAVPVDPRDLLRGDYVVLRYKVSSVHRGGATTAPMSFSDGQTVYVSLIQTDGDWTPEEVTLKPPEQGLFLRGRIDTVHSGRLDITYGIESFFVPEGEGLQYEEARNRNRLRAVISVGPRGAAHLKRLEFD